MIPPVIDSGTMSFLLILCNFQYVGSKFLALRIKIGKGGCFLKKSIWLSMLPVYAIVFSGALILTLVGSSITAVMWEAPSSFPERSCIIIDAGHGGIDSGATSCTGVAESHINLQIALRLEDMLHLLGYDTKMIRRTDISIYTQGQTIGQQKVSDLKERVRIANEHSNTILVSIHQNYFSDPRYSGAQVFYPQTKGSQELAKQMQAALIAHSDPESTRQIKRSKGIYLMDKLEGTGILIECGFLSNSSDNEKLTTAAYQQQLSAIIAATLANYLES